MLNLIRTCQQKPLNRLAIQENLNALRFATDILPKVYKTTQDLNTLRGLLHSCQQKERDLAINDVFYASLYEYFDAFNYNRSGNRLNTVDSTNQREFALDSLYSLEQYTQSQNKPSIGVLNFFESSACTVTGFVLAPYGRIPLHDHPSLSVFMKIVFGSIRITSFDATTPTASPSNHIKGPCNARLVTDAILSDTEQTITIEGNGTGGSYHHICTGRHGGIFVDVISPPYGAPPSFSDCTYYSLNRRYGQSAELDKNDTYTFVSSKEAIHVPMHLLPIR